MSELLTTIIFIIIIIIFAFCLGSYTQMEKPTKESPDCYMIQVQADNTLKLVQKVE